MECKYCGMEIPDDAGFCPCCGGKIKKRRRLPALSQKNLLLAIAVGVWIIVFQNLGLIPVSQNVNVKNKVDMTGDVKVRNTVDVQGGVDVNNCVQVDLREINGHSDVFFNNPKRGENNKYYVLPVTIE